MIGEETKRIYLGDKRLAEQTKQYCQMTTIIARDSDMPSEDIQICEVTLSPGFDFQKVLPFDAQVIALPLVGKAVFKAKKESLVDIEQIRTDFVAANSPFFIQNPYLDSPNNCLVLVRNSPPSETNEQFSFSLKKKNNFVNILKQNHNSFYSLTIGKFDGRNEGTFHTIRNNSKVFVFVIDGAFEVQDCLLEKSDCLEIENANRIEFEALSNEAIILVQEIHS